MSKENSLIHKTVGDILKKAVSAYANCTLLVDKACGGNQRIPLFYVANKTRAAEYCNVDLMILKENEVKTIVEIEESNVKPTQICGKFLTSALSNYDIHDSKGNNPVRMADSVTFIQVVDTSKLVKGKTAKFKQWKALERSINRIIPLRDSRITKYRLLTTDELGELESLIKKTFCTIP